jgi:ubiquinone/menaquinone biosynthesis C-methylase UbiE
MPASPDVYATARGRLRARVLGPLAARARAGRHREFFGRAGVRPGMRVVDIGCGSLGLRALEPDLDITGVDLSPRPDYPGPFVHADATERLPFADGEFDALTVGYLFRYVEDPAATIRELARVVKPGGTIASLEFFVPRSPPLRALWRVYTRVGLPLLGRLVSREWAEVGRFLARSIPGYYERYPLTELCGQWRAAGIGSVTARPMSLGAGVVMWGKRNPVG